MQQVLNDEVFDKYIGNGSFLSVERPKGPKYLWMGHAKGHEYG